MKKPAPSPSLYHRMRRLNQRMAANYQRGFGPRRIVLLLTTTGRKTGLRRVTPLQYEEHNGILYVASARGLQADWFRNLTADPHVNVQVQDRQFEALAEPVTDPGRIADFLELRIRRHPIMMRLLLLMEGLPPWAGRTRLEQFARQKAIVALHPC